MKTPFKELLNGKYFWILFLCFLIILKLVVEKFEMADQLAKPIPIIKRVAFIILLIFVAHFVLTLLIILITSIRSGTYDKWINEHKATNFGRAVEAFISPAYISLAVIIYGVYTYFSLTLSWSFFLALVGVQAARNIYGHFAGKKEYESKPE